MQPYLENGFILFAVMVQEITKNVKEAFYQSEGSILPKAENFLSISDTSNHFIFRMPSTMTNGSFSMIRLRELLSVEKS